MKITMLLCTTFLLSVCETKRYPIATTMSAVERETLTCRELTTELARTDQIEAEIANTATTDWRSIAGFLGDYGIGNAIVKSEASKGLIERRMSIKSALVGRGCTDASLSHNLNEDTSIAIAPGYTYRPERN